jgi:hypothetical protein
MVLRENGCSKSGLATVDLRGVIVDTPDSTPTCSKHATLWRTLAQNTQ